MLMITFSNVVCHEYKKIITNDPFHMCLFLYLMIYFELTYKVIFFYLKLMVFKNFLVMPRLIEIRQISVCDFMTFMVPVLLESIADINH